MPKRKAIDTGDSAHASLRERKKAKTRALIQAEALRLFRERGYDETSIDEIAEAAEVSARTVFRYFPTKPDLVRYDALDDVMVAAVRAQPAGASAIEAMRAGMRAAFGRLGAPDMDVVRERARLMRTVPELRAVMLEELGRSVGLIATMLAERSGRRPDDETVVTLAGAVAGVAMAAWLSGGEGGLPTDLVGRIDRGLALIEAGIRL